MATAERAMPWFYYAGRVIMRLLLLLLTRWRVTGRENIPRDGPLIIVANHLNLADPPLLGVSINRKTMIMAKEELFRNSFIRFFVSNFGAFPVHRSRFDRQAMRQALKLLADGTALIMFPEGTRSQDGRLRAALPGAALIASLSGAPVLPVGIVGTDKLKGPWWWLRRPRITVNIGTPFQPAPGGSRLTREELAGLTHSIMRHIAEVLPEEYRGVYAHENRKG